MFWNHNLFLLILILLLSFAGRAEKPDVEFDMFLETMFDAFSDSLYDAAAVLDFFFFCNICVTVFIIICSFSLLDV